MKLSFDWQVRPLYNVIARIRGSVFPDEWILSATITTRRSTARRIPVSGNVALMETARGLAELVKRGWKPKRTIVLGVMGR